MCSDNDEATYWHDLRARENAAANAPKPTMPNPDTRTVVTEADRRLFLLLDLYRTCSDKMILAGWADDTPEMQAIAAHRIAAEARVSAREVALREALWGMVGLYDDDEGCRDLPQVVAARAALHTDGAGS